MSLARCLQPLVFVRRTAERSTKKGVKMPAQAYYDDDFAAPRARDAAELLRAVRTLCDDEGGDGSGACDQGGYGSSPGRATTRPRRGRSGEYWQEEAGRIREEIDHLVSLYEVACGRRPRDRTPRATRHRETPRARPPSTDAWLKKMFMFMMLAELV